MGCVAWVGAFVARHGHNLPTDDEWAFVNVTYASTGDQFKWLGKKHIEHRFPLGRLLVLVLLHVTGHDYRAGMWLTVAFLATTAALFILAAHRLRGHTVLADAIFPLLFLHVGHTENLLMGYQVVFTLTVLALGAFALLTSSTTGSSRGLKALLGSICLLVIANGGWQGLLFVPWVGVWVAVQTWKALQTEGERQYGWTAAAIVTVVAVYLAYSGCTLLDDNQGRKKLAAATVSEVQLRAVGETIGIGIGLAGSSTPACVARTGWILLVVQAIVAIALILTAWRRPDRRAAAFGLLAILVGVWSFAVGIGYARGTGYASRYTTFTALGVAVPFLFLAKFVKRSAFPATVLVAATMAYMLPGNMRHGKGEGFMMDRHF